MKAQRLAAVHRPEAEHPAMKARRLLAVHRSEAEHPAMKVQQLADALPVVAEKPATAALQQTAVLLRPEAEQLRVAAPEKHATKALRMSVAEKPVEAAAIATVRPPLRQAA